MSKRFVNLFTKCCRSGKVGRGGRGQESMDEGISHSELARKVELEEANRPQVIENYWPNPNPGPPPKVIPIPDLHYTYVSDAELGDAQHFDDYVEADKPFISENFGLEFGEFLEEGGYGTVYQGVVSGNKLIRRYRVRDVLEPMSTEYNNEPVIFRIENGEKVPYVERNLEGKKFAVKVMILEYNSEVAATELKILEDLDHENVVDMYLVLTIHGHSSNSEVSGSIRVYIFMEYAEHGSLDDFFDRIKHPFTDDLCHDFVIQLIKGLQYIQSQRILHNDIKPQNILVFEGNSDHQYIIKYADFGIAELDSNLFLEDMTRIGDIFEFFYDKLPDSSTVRPPLDFLMSECERNAFSNCQELIQRMNNRFPDFLSAD